MVRQRLVSLLIAATLLLSGCFVRSPGSPDEAGLVIFNGNVFIFDEATGKAYLIFCQSLTDGISTNESNINEERVFPIPAALPELAVAVSNVASFNFSKCKQVFVSDNFNDNFVPIAAELTGKLICDLDLENDNSEPDGTAKLAAPGPTATTGSSHHKNPAPTSTTVIELFSSNDNLACFNFPAAIFVIDVGPFSASSTASSGVTAQKFNQYAAQIRKFLKNHPGGR